LVPLVRHARSARKGGEILCSSGERAYIPLATSELLVAWSNDPRGSDLFVTPPVDLDGQWLQLRIHRTPLGFVIDGAAPR
jgi:hypothetical protein